jgi:hypothetical protein
MNNLQKHEYLQREEFYEFRNIGTKARSSKTCDHCGKTIPQGEPHLVATFDPEFNGYPIHKECEAGFMNSLN